MIDREPPVTEDELHAYVDGELPADRLSAVEAWLAAHPDDAGRVADWRGQNAMIRDRYAAIAGEAVPPDLSLRSLSGGRRSLVAKVVAAACLAFLIGGTAGWMARGASAAAPGALAIVTEDALAAHRLYVVEVRHPVEVPGAERSHLVQWLSKRIGYPLTAPDLQGIGLKLVGGRLLPGPTGAAAFFMYERASGERFTIYCARTTAPASAMRYAAAGRTAAMTWVDRNVAYVVSGPEDRDGLTAVAQRAYEQFEAVPSEGGRRG